MRQPLVALVLLACGTEQAPPSVLPEPAHEPTGPVAEQEREPPAPEVDSTRRVRVVVVPAEVRLPPSLPSRDVPYPNTYGYDGAYEPGSWPRVEPTDPSLAWLTDAIKAETDGFIARMADCEDCGDPIGAGCSIATTTPDLIALDCGGYMMSDRGSSDVHSEVRLYGTVGGHLTRFQLRDALLPDTPFERIVTTHCVQRVAIHQRESGEGDATPQAVCSWVEPFLSIRARGIRMEFGCSGDYFESGRDCQVDIPYAELDRKILADSPLGRALLSVEGVTSEEVVLPAETILPGEERAGFAVAPAAPLEDTIARWAALDAAQRADLRIAADDIRATSLVLEDERAATERARAIGGELRPLSWHSSLTPFTGRLRVMTNVRASISRVLAAPGTRVTGVRGLVHGRESSIGARNTWVFALVAPSVAAWIAGNLVEETSDCVPSPEPFLSELPASIRARAARTIITVPTELPGREPRPAVMFVGITRPPGRATGRFRVSVYERDGCNVGRRLQRSDLTGYLRGFAMTSTQASGGEPLLVVAARPPGGNTQWSVYRFGSPTAAFSAEQEEGTEVVPGLREGRAWYPLAFRSENAEHALRVRWDGSGLTSEPVTTP
jgi:hypothetical protein